MPLSKDSQSFYLCREKHSELGRAVFLTGSDLPDDLDSIYSTVMMAGHRIQAFGWQVWNGPSFSGLTQLTRGSRVENWTWGSRFQIWLSPNVFASLTKSLGSLGLGESLWNLKENSSACRRPLRI